MIYAAIVFILYIIFTFWKGGITYCISDTYYTLGNYKIMFTLFCIILAALSAYPLWISTIGVSKILVILCILALLLLGFFPRFKENQQFLHYGCCIIMTLSIIILYIIKGLWFVPVAMVLTGVRKNWLLGIETAYYSCLFIYPYL